MTLAQRLGLLGVLAFALIVALVPTAAHLNAENEQIPLQTHDFVDVPVADKEFMEPFINALYHQGVTTGCNPSPLQYCPEQNVTRGEMAVFIGRALGYVAAVTAGHNTKAYFENTGIATYGVIGRSLGGYGVWGESSTGVGVYGTSSTSSGILGNSPNGWGVNGFSTNGTGVYGSSTNGYGVIANSANGSALQASSSVTNSTADAIFDVVLGGTIGEMFGETLALYSNGSIVVDLDNNNNDAASSFNIYNGSNGLLFTINEGGTATIYANTTIQGSHTITGAKSALVDTVHYGERLMYAVESTELWFEDFGSAQLVDGEVIIEIDAMFAETVNLSETYHVFLTPIDASVVLHVTNRTATSFTVRADEASNLEFSYRIVAKRLGYEDTRMESPNN